MYRNRNHSTPYLPILPILCIYYNSGFNVCVSFVLISGIRSFLMAGIVNPQVLLGAAFASPLEVSVSGRGGNCTGLGQNPSGQVRIYP